MSLADVWQNPILLRAQRQSARVRRTPWVVLSVLVALTLLVASIGGLAAESGDPASVGTGISATFFVSAAFFVMMIGAFLAGQSLSSEHQGRTWEMLLLTGMTPRRIVAGKFLSTVANVLFYLVALSPVAAVPFVFGGVSALEVLLGFGALVALACLAAAFGLAAASSAPQHGGVWSFGGMFLIFACASPFAGFGGPFLVQAIWPSLRIDSPNWWPAAVARAPIDLRYVLFAWLIPLAGVSLPSWLGIELTIAQVSEPGQDRFYSFKRALLVSVVIVGGLSCGTVLCATDADQVFSSLAFGLGLHALLAMTLMALAADDPYPYRRARHELSGRSTARRLLGPSLLRGSMLFLVAWMLSLMVLGAVGAAQLLGYGAAPYKIMRLVVTVGYAIPFVLFVAGYLVFLRTGGHTPAVSRLLTSVVALALTGAPWVLYAIVGGISHTSASSAWLALGAPSPVYIGVMLAALAPRLVGHDPFLLWVGLIMASTYLLLAMAFFFAAARRTRKAFAAELAYQAEVDRRLLEEDRSAHDGQAEDV